MRAFLGSVAVLSLLAPTAEAKEFADFTADGRPNVQAESVVVMAPDGGIYFEKNADEQRHIASTGKIFVAMAVRRAGIDLEAATEITKVDRDFARGGARTRLDVGRKFRNIDLLRAMLIASDNRAPSALGRAVGWEADRLIAEMNRLARDLGLRKTHFTDTCGLRGNVSTAREMAHALRKALEDPVLAEIMTTDKVTVRSVEDTRRRPRVIDYRNTNRAVHSERFEVTGGKTGYTNAAGYCLVTATRFDGKEVFVSLLGVHNGKLTRYGDLGRIAKWLESEHAPAEPRPVTRTAEIPPASVGRTAAGKLRM